MIDREIKVLDKGFVRVVDIMGNDESIVQAARVSYGKGTKHTSQDRALIRYLMRHKHTTPFEMCEIKFHLKMPMVIAEQLLRHRTASVNKYSGRYSEMLDEFYIPCIADVSVQSNNNKQGRGENLNESQAQQVVNDIKQHCSNSYKLYQQLLEQGVARELARMVLPSNIYTQLYWKIDLHNLLHFVQLRSHDTAQYEIRRYSYVIEAIVKEWVPIAYEAFVDYKKEAVSVAKNVRNCLKRNDQELLDLGKTELAEFEEIWGKLK